MLVHLISQKLHQTLPEISAIKQINIYNIYDISNLYIFNVISYFVWFLIHLPNQAYLFLF